MPGITAGIEFLSVKERINEYVMTSLRTMWGLNLDKIEKEFGNDYSTIIQKSATQFLDKEWLFQEGKIIRLTATGKLFADHIAAALFIDY